MIWKSNWASNDLHSTSRKSFLTIDLPMLELDTKKQKTAIQSDFILVEIMSFKIKFVACVNSMDNH